MRDKLTFKELKERRAMIQDDISRCKKASGYDLYWPQIGLLLEMAINGDIPTGDFSDRECSVWSNMRMVLQNNNIEIRDL